MEKTETYQFANREDYLKAIDMVILPEHIKKRQLGGNKSQEYLPIAIQEVIADYVFQQWNVTSENFIRIENEIICTVKINYVPAYPEADEQFCTGSAAKPIQMSTGSKTKDYPANKMLNALEYCLPSARKTAIGCALEGIGNIFGRNIGRKLDQNTLLPSNFTIRNHGE